MGRIAILDCFEYEYRDAEYEYEYEKNRETKHWTEVLD
jgi:hypothetical protein